MKEKIFGIRRNVFLLGLTSLFNDFSAEMITAILPAFFVLVLHAHRRCSEVVFIHSYRGVLSRSRITDI